MIPIPPLLGFICQGLLILLCAILFHEVCHLLTLWGYTGKKPRFQFLYGKMIVGTAGEFRNLKKKEQFTVLFNGFLGGIAVLFIVFLALGGALWVFGLLIPYLFGSIPDLRGMYQLTQTKKVKHGTQ